MEIPKTLLDPEKLVSRDLAAHEVAVHGNVYEEARQINDAIPRIQVPLPETTQSIYLSKDQPWLSSPVLHLFGIAGLPDKEKTHYGEPGVHLVTFTKVSYVAGTNLKEPGVTLGGARKEDERYALPSSTPEFQFVVDALAVMKAYVEQGYLR